MTEDIAKLRKMKKKLKKAKKFRKLVNILVSMIEEHEYAEHIAQLECPNDKLASRLEEVLLTLVNEISAAKAEANMPKPIGLSKLKLLTERVRNSRFGVKHSGHKQVDGYGLEEFDLLYSEITRLLKVNGD